MWPFGLGMFLSAVGLILLGACAAGGSDRQVVTISISPTHYHYSQEFLDLAAEETGVLGEPCDRNAIDHECSALLRLILDYGRVREQIREIKE